MDAVILSRLQFAITAMYHFIFVPLTLGLIIIVATMETIYVITGKEIWRKMTKFWGLLFGINFAMGVATGVTMEFQFGTNWSYYAHFVGDIFGVPLALEGMMAFFLEATFAGLFFFGWDKLSRGAHLACTWILALGTSLSAFWILVANAWMQYPVGAAFNPQTMRMELTSLYKIVFSPVAQCKFVHTITAGYVTGAIFVIAVSCYYLLRGRHTELARRSIWVASIFGFVSSLSVVLLGDESGYTLGHGQKMKLAAIEAEWHTEPPPAAFTVIGWPDKEQMKTHYAVRIPWVLGLIATRSLDKPVLGIQDIIDRGIKRIKKGVIGYQALQGLQNDPFNPILLKQFKKNRQWAGYALLLKRHHEPVVGATDAQIQRAARDLMPNVPLLFFSFRIMVACGAFFILFFALMLWHMHRESLTRQRWLMRVGVLAIPLPWIASWCGWIVAESGRQPWVIDHILPTYYGASSLPVSFIWTTLGGFVFLYTTMAVVDLYLMLKYIRLGPGGHDAPKAPQTKTSLAST